MFSYALYLTCARAGNGKFAISLRLFAFDMRATGFVCFPLAHTPGYSDLMESYTRCPRESCRPSERERSAAHMCFERGHLYCIIIPRRLFSLKISLARLVHLGGIIITFSRITGSIEKNLYRPCSLRLSDIILGVCRTRVKIRTENINLVCRRRDVCGKVSRGS